MTVLGASLKILLAGGKIVLLDILNPDFLLIVLAFIFHADFQKNIFIDNK